MLIFYIKELLKWLEGSIQYLLQKSREPNKTESEQTIREKQEDILMEVNWLDPKAKVSKYFTVHECTFLPSWRIYHQPSEEEKKTIIEFAKTMDIVRERIGKPITVHVWIRPKSVNAPGSDRHGQDYNLFIGSKSTKSGHIFGNACDFHVSGYIGPEKCAEIRAKIMPWLEELDIRMEDINGGWVHLDSKPVGSKRFFKP